MQRHLGLWISLTDAQARTLVGLYSEPAAAAQAIELLSRAGWAGAEAALDALADRLSEADGDSAARVAGLTAALSALPAPHNGLLNAWVRASLAIGALHLGPELTRVGARIDHLSVSQWRDHLNAAARAAGVQLGTTHLGGAEAATREDGRFVQARARPAQEVDTVAEALRWWLESVAPRVYPQGLTRLNWLIHGLSAALPPLPEAARATLTPPILQWLDELGRDAEEAATLLEVAPAWRSLLEADPIDRWIHRARPDIAP